MILVGGCDEWRIPFHSIQQEFSTFWFMIFALLRSLAHTHPPVPTFTLDKWLCSLLHFIFNYRMKNLLMNHHDNASSSGDVHRCWSWTHSTNEWQADADFPLLNSCFSLQQFTLSQLSAKAFSITGVLRDATVVVVAAGEKLWFVVMKYGDDAKISLLLLMVDGVNFSDLPLSSVFTIVDDERRRRCRRRRDRDTSDAIKGHCWADFVDVVDVDERQICSRMKLHAAIMIIKLMTT